MNPGGGGRPAATGEEPRIRLAVHFALRDGATDVLPENLEVVGKRYRLNGASVEKEVALPNGNHLVVFGINTLEEFAGLAEGLAGGLGFFTSGIPLDAAPGDVLAVVSKKRKHRFFLDRDDVVARTGEDLHWQKGVGTYLVVDFDPDWCPHDLTGVDVDERLVRMFRHALQIGGLPDDAQPHILTYESSSSSFLRADTGKRLDKGGRHGIVLVRDAADLPRFRDAVQAYLTHVEGACYGAVSKSGSFLKRGIVDPAAIQPQQPTFIALPWLGEGLAPAREYRVHEGAVEVLDTSLLPSPTPQAVQQATLFWKSERARLHPDLTAVSAAWEIEYAQELRRSHPDATEARLRETARARRHGHLYVGDVVTLNGQQVEVRELLTDPAKYDGWTGPDPVEPEYHGGAQKAKFFANLGSTPTIYSQAHGGVTYRLWHSVESLGWIVADMDKTALREALPRLIALVRPRDGAEMGGMLKELARAVGYTKKDLEETYKLLLRRNMNDENLLEDVGSAGGIVDDAFLHACEITARHTLELYGSELWRYDGKVWARLPDQVVKRWGQEIAARDGFNELMQGSLSAHVDQVLQNVRTLSVPRGRSTLGQPPRPVLNLRNGELHFGADGTKELRPHAAASGLTFLLDADYDATARAPLFERTLVEMLMPAAAAWDALAGPEKAQVTREAEEGAGHLAEVLAYICVPDRWLKVWFLFYGGGNNGKTMLGRLVTAILGDAAVEACQFNDIAGNAHGTARLIGKALFLDDDLKVGISLDDSFLKTFSEGKLFSANLKHRDSVTAYNRTATMLLSNNWPKLADLSEGTQLRISAAKFSRRFWKPSEIDDPGIGAEERELRRRDSADPHRLEQIMAELPGVVNVLADAYSRLVVRGDFAPPARFRAAKEEMLARANPLTMFLAEKTRRDSKGRIPRSEFQQDFSAWCQLQEFGGGYHPSAQKVREQMESLGFGVTVKDGHEQYAGLAWIDPRSPRKY